MKKLNTFLALGLLFSATIANAQWDTTITQYYDYTGGPLYSNDIAEDFDRDASGNFYVAGEITNGTADQNVHLIKYKTNGTNSSVNYTTTNYYENVKKVICSGNLVFVINNSYGVGLNGYRMSILRYNSSLVLQNAAYYHSDSLFEPVDACLDASGNIYVACRQSNGTASNIAVVKLTAGGTNISAMTKVFQSSLTDNYTEIPKDISYSSINNRIYLAGGVTSNSTGYTATLLVSINPTTMVEQWRKTSSFLSGRNILNSVVETGTYVFAAGCKISGLNNNNNFYVVRYSVLGTNSVSINYTGPSAGYNYNEGLKIISTNPSEVKIVGCSKDSIGSAYDVIYATFPIALNASPTIIRKTLPYNSAIGDAAYESGGGHVYVTGRKAVGLNQNMFFYTMNDTYRDSIISRSACGNKIYVIPAGPGTPASAWVIGYQDKNKTAVQPTDLKFFFRRYKDTDIAKMSSDLSEELVESTIYPNPAIDRVTIKSTEKINQIIVMDAIGKVVYKTQSTLSEIFEMQIDISAFTNGLYFVQVNSKSTEKLIKQ